jgi:hypothetical protein
LGTVDQLLYLDYQQASGAENSIHHTFKRSGECELIRSYVMSDRSIFDLAGNEAKQTSQGFKPAPENIETRSGPKSGGKITNPDNQIR